MHQHRALPSFPGSVFTSQELIYFMGLSSHHQVERGCERGEYARLDHGIFMIPGADLTREAAFTFCVRRYPYLHVGGKTALIWRGLLPAPEIEEPVVMFGTVGSRPPEWITERFPLRFSNRCPFNQKLPRNVGLEPLLDQPEGIPVSIPERALIEYLDDEGREGGPLTLETIHLTMQAMGGLQADVLAPLFKSCFRPRVVRLCAIWAEKLQFPWLPAALAAAPKAIHYRPNTMPLRDDEGNQHWLTPPNALSVIKQTNKLANLFLSKMGTKYRDNYRFDLAEEPREVLCWEMACAAQKLLTAVNVEKAVTVQRKGTARKLRSDRRRARGKKIQEGCTNEGIASSDANASPGLSNDSSFLAVP